MKRWPLIRDVLSFAVGVALVAYERIDTAPTDETLLLLAAGLLGLPFAARADGAANARSRSRGEDS